MLSVHTWLQGFPVITAQEDTLFVSIFYSLFPKLIKTVWDGSEHGSLFRASGTQRLWTFAPVVSSETTFPTSVEMVLGTTQALVCFSLDF